MSGMVTASGEIRTNVSRECGAVTGDTFSTLHGLEGVVTDVPDCFMPVLPDGGVADIILGRTTLVKRGTVGQQMECNALSVADVELPIISDDLEVPSFHMNHNRRRQTSIMSR